MTPALELTGISKSFDGFMALSAADFAVVPDDGHIRINGERVTIRGPIDAKAYSIGMVHQHFKLVRPFNALENILLSDPRGNFSRGLKQIAAEVRRHCEAL